MTYTTVERDDIAHVIRATLKLFGRNLDDDTKTTWLEALGTKYEARDVVNAFHRYQREGRAIPRPVDILDLLAARQVRAPEEQTENKLPIIDGDAGRAEVQRLRERLGFA
ncbi:MAG: hypothetical protein AAF662_10105 [Pseudomonadota bacterium]